MKIAYINGGLSVSETFIYDLIKGLSKRYEIMFYPAQNPYYTEGLAYKKIDYLLPKGVISFVNRVFPRYGKRIIWMLSQDKILRKLLPEIKDYNLIYVDYGTTAVASLKLLQKSKKRFVVHFHGFDITSALKDTYYRKKLQVIFGSAKYVICASEHIRRLLILEGCPVEKVKVIRYGLNTELVIDGTKNVDEKNHLVFIGRLTDKKHPIALIQAFNLVQKQVSNTILNVVGSGPLEGKCKSLVADLGIENKVFFHGELPNKNALALLRAADIYVQHSVTATSGDQEGFGISMAEAALYGKPVVSTFHNGIPEHVIDGETGYLVPEFNFEMMADQIIELINNPEKAKEMGLKGQKHITKLCDSEKRVKQIAELIEK